jgi:hypothetical protein
MSNVSFKVNYIELGKIFEQKIDSDSRVGNLVDNYIKNFFQKNKNLLISEFNNHKITVELRNGPGASNISNTLGGYGNLFSFFGFFQSKNPTKELEDLLSSMSIRKTTRKGRVFYYTINLPTKSQIAEATRMDWGSGTSWAYAVESGGFGGDADLSHYIYKTWLKGRSKKGVQIKANYSEKNFSPKPYLTPIFENFQKRINANIQV